MKALPKGRHNLSRDQVEASQRARLIRATVQLGNERGFASLSLTDIVSRAGVARSTFYEYFADKEQCFLEAFDYSADLVLARVFVLEPALAGDFSSSADAYIARFLELCVEEPDLARLVVANASALGPAAAERERRFRDRLADGLVKLRDIVRRGEPRLAPITHVRALAIVGALTEVLHRTFYKYGISGVPALQAELAAILLGLLKAPPAAVLEEKPLKRVQAKRR